jgi:hypothetical protein
MGLLQLVEQLLNLTPVGLLGVGTLRDVCRQVLEMGVQGNLLLGDVPKRLRAWDKRFAVVPGPPPVAVLEGSETGVEVTCHLRYVSLQEVHQCCLGLVVEIVTSKKLVSFEIGRVSGENVPPKHPTVCAS